MDYLLHQLIQQGRLEIHIAPFNFKSHHRCQNYRSGLTFCVAIVSLPLRKQEQDEVFATLDILQANITPWGFLLMLTGYADYWYIMCSKNVGRHIIYLL